MIPKFKYGDKVKVVSYGGKVISIRKDNTNGYIYKIKFDNSNLIPPEMEFTEIELLSNNKVSDDSECPICGTKWTVVKFNMQVWKDCKKCQKTSEDITKEMQKINEKNSKSSTNLDDIDQNDYHYSDITGWYDDDF
jgi:hypothetical protein